MDKSELSVDLAKVLNRHNIDTETDTPDFILADMLVAHIGTLIEFQEANERWHRGDKAELMTQLPPHTGKKLIL